MIASEQKLWLGMAIMGSLIFSGFSVTAQGALVSDSPGATALWHMDAAPGGMVADDDSANPGRDNDLTLSSGASLTTGLDGNALVCDGSSTYGISAYTCLPTTSVHVELYIKCSTTSPPAEGYHILNADSLWQVVQVGNKIYLYGSGNKVKSHGVLTTTDWWKIEGDVVASGVTGTATITLTNMTDMSTYTNSAAVDTNWSGATPKNVMVGAIDVGTGPLYHFAGLIDDVKVDAGAVPEPASLALMGAAGLMLLRRK